MDETTDPHGIDKVFCHLPWMHLCAHLDGVYSRCCVDTTGLNTELYLGSNRPTMTLPEDAVGCSPKSTFAADNPDLVMSPAEAFNSAAMRRTRLAMLAGDPVSACRTCYERERLTGDSYRLQMTRQDKPALGVEECRGRTEDDGTVAGFPSFLDLRLGNHCNLRCVMCGVPTSSSLVQRSDDTWLRNSLDPYTDDDTFWQCIEDNIQSIESMYFAGGEPLMLRAHQRLLQLFVDNGRAAEMDLTYATNLTLMPPAVLELWRSFRLVSLEASCDGVGPVFELVRAGGRWADFERNADLVKDQVQLSIHASPQRDNVFNLGEVIDWSLGRGLDVHISNVIREPAELSVRNLPPAEKERAHAYLDTLAGRLTTAGHKMPAADVRGVLRYLLAPPTLTDGLPSASV
jgi:sulfatase maturation enzyme AslB (radical SAM superfamily)